MISLASQKSIGLKLHPQALRLGPPQAQESLYLLGNTTSFTASLSGETDRFTSVEFPDALLFGLASYFSGCQAPPVQGKKCETADEERCRWKDEPDE